jgi:signal transduction histidine kinase/predicted ATPase
LRTLLRTVLPEELAESELLYNSERTLVVRGRHPVYGQTILKTTTQPLPDPVELARYRHEHRALRLLDGRGSARALGLEERAGRPLLYLEDTGGTALRNLLGERSPAVICGWLCQLAAALHEVHSVGIIHRDLSLSNLIRSPETGALSIIDFGECAILSRRHTAVDPPSVPRGTLATISPEQTGRVGHRVDVRADLYSLGACFWHLLVGRPPFDTADPLGLIHAHLAQSPQPPLALRRDCPETLSAIIMKLLEKNPADRYQSAAGLLADARRCAAEPESLFELGLVERPARLVYPGSLFGRDIARAQLRAAYLLARGGQRSAVVITGAAGVGKSALAARLRPMVSVDRGLLASGAFERGQGSPYHGWIAALRGLLRGILAEDATALAEHRAALAAALALDSASLWSDALPELAILLGDAPAAPAPSLSPEATRARVHASIVAMLRALATPARPIVLLLEDLQWIDPASADLLQTVISEGIPGLLLAATRQAGGAAPGGLTPIPLRALSADSVQALLSACCRCAVEETEELTAVLMAKTSGNPRQLRALIERALREDWLHATRDGWSWDREAISEMDPDEGDLGALAALASMPPESQQALSAAALLGMRFSLSAISAVIADSEEDCRALLLPAVEAWLLLPAGIDGFRFGQVQIQQRCEALLPATDRPMLHRAVGWVLDEDPASRFEAVRHLRAALPILPPEERIRLAERACEVGEQAWAAAAFEAASDSFDAGTHALGSEGWSSHYDLMLALTTGACRAARLSGQIDRKNHHIDALLRDARTIADKTPAWLVRMEDRLDANQLAEAIAVTDDFLKQVGRRQILRLSPLALARGFVEVLVLLRGRTPEHLLDLPLADDPIIAAIQQVQLAVAHAQFQLTPKIIPQAIFRDIRDVLRDGLTAWGAHSWTGLAMLLIMGPGWVRLGTRFGQLSLDQVNRLSRPDLWPRSAFVQVFAILPWSVRHRELVAPMEEVTARAFAAGDPITAMNSALVRDALLLLTGAPLDRVQAALEESAEQARRSRTSLNAGTLSLLLRLVRQLRGEAVSETAPPATEEERIMWRGSSLLTGLVLGDEIDWTILDMPFMNAPVVAFPHLYLWTLAGVAALHGRRAGTFPALRATAVYWKAYRQVRRWARHRPARRYRLDWLRAERAHQLGRVHAALRLYEAALRGAQAEEIHYDAAIIAEHAAELCAASGLERMSVAMAREAQGAYRSWGALARISTVDTPETASQSHRSTGSTNIDTLDLLSIIKASQALSEEVTYSRLLDRIMGTLLENTGATSGLVILDGVRGPQVAARVSVSQEAVDLPCPLVGSGLGPEALIQFVLRTGEEIVLEDATSAEADTWFPDLLVSRPRAVLCTPVGRGSVVGAIYLENDLIAGCFTQVRLEAARLLMSQVSISLENADLVEGLEARVAQRTEELEAARQRAESASQAKSTFLANMSHELRTPLNAILGYAQLLQDSTGLEANHSSGLRTIYRSGTHLLGLINDVLDMSRIEAGRFELEVSPTQTRALLLGVVDIFRVSAQKKGIRLDHDLDPTLPPGIMVDARRVRQLLLNLIGNAVKFTEQGGVTVSARPEEGELCVVVQDTGPGIPADRLQAVFEAFEQAGGAEQRAKGTGLGLAITRQIATRMGGNITVVSQTEPPSGSTFTLTLPLRPCAVGDVRPLNTIDTSPEEAAPAEMSVPELPILEGLLKRTLVGDLSAVADQAEQLTEHPVFARRLRELAREFDDHGLEALLGDLLEG